MSFLMLHPGVYHLKLLFLVQDLEYITALIKSLLKQRNRLRTCGQLDKAEVVAQKINTLISIVIRDCHGGHI